MWRHIIALPILLLSLLAAGMPAFACAEEAPTQECCPNGPNGPCAPEQAGTAQANRLDSCCAAGGTIATTTAIAAPSNDSGKHSDRAATPTILIALVTLTTAYVQAPSIDGFRPASQPLSESTLYLSTGRLRL
jgi:hypothetical protein